MPDKPAPPEQPSMRLCGDERFEKSGRVMKAADKTDARHGRNTLRSGAAPAKGRWQRKFMRRPRCYTTRLAASTRR